jgi:hypothetical protein
MKPPRQLSKEIKKDYKINPDKCLAKIQSSKCDAVCETCDSREPLQNKLGLKAEIKKVNEEWRNLHKKNSYVKVNE